MSKKDLLASILFNTGLLRVIGMWTRFFNKNLIVLSYHRVLPVWDDEHYPGDVELVSASVADFNWQIEHVKENFKVISFQQLDGMVNEKENVESSVIVTFDDGFADNYEHAYPVLQKHGAPAVFFVTTGYIGKKKTFWFERISEQLKLLKNQTIEFPMLNLALEIGSDNDSISSAFKELLDELKVVQDSVRIDALELLDSMTGDAPLVVDTISRPLNWLELKELSENNISIHPHTVTHPALANCTDEQIRYELAESKAELESSLGCSCDIFSYPFGGEDSCHSEVLKCLDELGYTYACTYKPPGGNVISKLDKYQIMRIHVERYTTRARFAASLVLPQVFN